MSAARAQTRFKGLLDKIYEGFGIKDYDEGKNDPVKREVTEKIYDCFVNDPDKKKFEFKDDNSGIQDVFLPGMVVHSGRSKPTREDMPQHLPFVQYSAIEHAVKDCKFSLVEVIDYAKYE